MNCPALSRVAASFCALSLAPLGGGVFAQVPTSLEPTDCPFANEEWATGARIECRWLVVPENRLFVVILRADSARGKTPLVLLHGGPGESALMPMLRGALRRARPDRDIVIYDQRGAGLSQPEPCPGYAARVRELEALEPSGSPGRTALQTAARECAATMHAQGIDPAAYSTSANAADLVDLRRALGYEHWDVDGASYGARLALEAMRRDARGIGAVTLENPQPPGPEAAEAGASTQHVLERVFGACGRSPECHAAFPTPQPTLLAVFDTLARAPLAAPAGERSARPLSLDAEGLALALRRLLRSRAGIASIPFLLDQLLRGDRPRAAREILGLADAAAGRPGRAVFWLVRCNDEYGPAYGARLDSVRQAVWPALRGLGENLEDCPLWHAKPPARTEGAAVKSDIPTLVVAGEFDPAAPLEFGRRITATLTRSYLFELPAETHGGPRTGCRATILAQFRDDPLHKPDASCIARMPAIEFRTHW